MQEAPAGGFPADARHIGWAQKSLADFFHSNIPQEFHGRAAAFCAEGVLQSSCVDAGTVADVTERERQMGVGPHVLLSGMELARSGIVAAVEQSCVIVGMRLKQQSDEIILELAQGKGFSYAILVSTAENPAQFPHSSRRLCPAALRRRKSGANTKSACTWRSSIRWSSSCSKVRGNRRKRAP